VLTKPPVRPNKQLVFKIHGRHERSRILRIHAIPANGGQVSYCIHSCAGSMTISMTEGRMQLASQGRAMLCVDWLPMLRVRHILYQFLVLKPVFSKKIFLWPVFSPFRNLSKRSLK
jgi:hypothetical protein